MCLILSSFLPLSVHITLGQYFYFEYLNLKSGAHTLCVKVLISLGMNSIVWGIV